MMRVSFSNTSFLTSDAVAHSLLEFAAATARGSGSETVIVPAVTDEGALTEVEMVVGPASQMSAAPEATDFDEPETTEAIRAMDRATLASRAVITPLEDDDDDSQPTYAPDEFH
jgi:hypothetical protein